MGKDLIKISYLQFADDTILFFPEKEEIIYRYKRILDYFSLISRLRINYDKSALIPINCSNEWVEKMKSKLGYTVASLPIKYLGIPLGANPKRVETWKPIIEKIEKKLSS